MSGKHPFNRLSAVQARDKRMVPKRPRGLKRHQWKAFKHGLAFDRQERTASGTAVSQRVAAAETSPGALVFGIALLLP